MHKKRSLEHFPLFIFLLSLATSEISGNWLDGSICGTLFSTTNMVGNSFVSRDGDQSVNMKRDYRTSINGWGNTSSLKVEENCTLSACTGTYFEGNCVSYPFGNYSDNQIHQSNIQSVSCTCSRTCKCEDVGTFKNPDSCGRAYVNGTCNECNSKYIQLLYQKRWWNFPPEYAGLVKASAIRSGCNLTIFADDLQQGDKRVITDPIVQDFQGRIGSYECICDDNLYNPPPHPTSGTSDFSPLKLPRFSDDLLEMIFSNWTLAGHPGLNSAKASLQNGRSNQNAYILIIGTSYPDEVGLFRDCTSSFVNISECRVALNVLEKDISQTELRIISASFHPEAGSEAQWVASLDKYLSIHEELKDTIPNAVIIYHDPIDDPTISERGSKFQRKLATVNALRGRILDESYSNLVFAVYDREGTRNPEMQILEWEAAINENWSFPRPTVILPVYYDYNLPKVNEQWKRTSGEHYFKNIYHALLVASEKSGDTLGHAIFRAAFSVADTEWAIVSEITEMLLPTNDTNVERHQKLALDSAGLKAHISMSVLQREQKLAAVSRKIRVDKQLASLKHKITHLEYKNSYLERQNQNLNSHVKLAIKMESEPIKEEIWKVLKEDMEKRCE